MFVAGDTFSCGNHHDGGRTAATTTTTAATQTTSDFLKRIGKKNPLVRGGKFNFVRPKREHAMKNVKKVYTCYLPELKITEIKKPQSE